MEYARKTDFTSAACTEIYNANISSRIDHHTQKIKGPGVGVTIAYGHTQDPKKTHLRFPHNLAARADPGNEDEFLALRLFVVRVGNTGKGVGSLSRVQFLLKFS